MIAGFKFGIEFELICKRHPSTSVPLFHGPLWLGIPRIVQLEWKAKVLDRQPTRRAVVDFNVQF
jgi:hypothetical protein